MKLKNVLSQNEISALLNNAVLGVSMSLNLAAQSEERKRKVRNYTQELVKILEEDVAEGYFDSYEELVQMLTGASLWVYATKVSGNLKAPAFQDMAKNVLDEEAKKIKKPKV